jgi:hypothetical protein
MEQMRAQLNLPPLMDVPDTLDIWDASVRTEVKQLIVGSIVLEIGLIVLFIIVMLISYGNAWNPAQYYPNINIAVLNSDGASSTSASTSGVVGAAFDAVVQKMQVAAPYDFSIKVLDGRYETAATLRESVARGHYWAGIVVNEGASARVTATLYDTSTAATSAFAGLDTAFAFNFNPFPSAYPTAITYHTHTDRQ